MARVMQLEEGWALLRREAIDVLEEILESGIGTTTKAFPATKYAPIYT